MADRAPNAPSRPPGRRGWVRAPQDFAAGVSLIALALFALWASAGLEMGRLSMMGPGMMPRVVAVLIGLLGLVLVVLALVVEGPGLERWSVRGPFFVCLGVVAFALAIRTVGLVVAAPAVVLISGAASPETRPLELLVFAVVITLFCAGLFRYVLNLPIPILVIPGVVVL